MDQTQRATLEWATELYHVLKRDKETELQFDTEYQMLMGIKKFITARLLWGKMFSKQEKPELFKRVRVEIVGTNRLRFVVGEDEWLKISLPVKGETEEKEVQYDDR